MTTTVLLVIALQQPPAPPPPAAVAATPQEYLIGPQDKLDINVIPDVFSDKKVSVDVDGTFQYKDLGRVKAQDLTERQIAAEIKKMLINSGQHRDPTVTVQVVEFRSKMIYVNGDGGVQGALAEGGIKNTIIPIRGVAQEIEAWTGAGGHGGGDKVMLDELFLPTPPDKADKYLRAADERAGAASCLIGIAANRCFASGQAVKINELVSGLTAPDYAPMPSRTGPVPMPGKV